MLLVRHLIILNITNLQNINLHLFLKSILKYIDTIIKYKLTIIKFLLDYILYSQLNMYAYVLYGKSKWELMALLQGMRYQRKVTDKQL